MGSLEQLLNEAVLPDEGPAGELAFRQPEVLAVQAGDAIGPVDLGCSLLVLRLVALGGEVSCHGGNR